MSFIWRTWLLWVLGESWPRVCIHHLLLWPAMYPQQMEQLHISPGPQSVFPSWLASFLPCPGWAAASWPYSRNQFLPGIVWGWQHPHLGQGGRKEHSGCHWCIDGSTCYFRDALQQLLTKEVNGSEPSRKILRSCPVKDLKEHISSHGLVRGSVWNFSLWIFVFISV